MGRKRCRKLGIEDKLMMETIETILMLPFYIFKYAFSLAFWFYLIVFIQQSDWYYNISTKIREKLDAK